MLTVEYFEKAMEKLEARIQSNCINIKRSIIYDIRHEFQEVKSNILANSKTGGPPSKNLTEVRESLDVALPIQTMDDFLAFNVFKKKGKKESIGKIPIILHYIFFFLFTHIAFHIYCCYFLDVSLSGFGLCGNHREELYCQNNDSNGNKSN